MQLYKSRGFNEFFQDTFAFLKANGTHLYKHFFIINGIFLIILMVLGYFFMQFYTDIVFSSFGNPNADSIDNYMNENLGLFILLFILFLIVALVAGVISYAFVPIYLKLYNKTNGTNFSTQEIVNEYKANIGKIFIFLLCGFLLAIPMLVGTMISLFLLVITIIGILATPLVIAFVSLFYNMTLMEYIENKRNIWDSFGYSWKLIFSKFWHAVGCVGIFFLISYIVQNVIAMIPYIFGMASMFTTIESNNVTPEDVVGSMTFVMLLIFFLTFVVSTILNVVIQVNQGIVFYGLKEQTENTNTKSIIDQIGSGE
jgi:hypothetical protein